MQPQCSQSCCIDSRSFLAHLRVWLQWRSTHLRVWLQWGSTHLRGSDRSCVHSLRSFWKDGGLTGVCCSMLEQRAVHMEHSLMRHFSSLTDGRSSCSKHNRDQLDSPTAGTHMEKKWERCSVTVKVEINNNNILITPSSPLCLNTNNVTVLNTQEAWNKVTVFSAAS